jgi:hypothetical protein
MRIENFDRARDVDDDVDLAAVAFQVVARIAESAVGLVFEKRVAYGVIGGIDPAQSRVVLVEQAFIQY